MNIHQILNELREAGLVLSVSGEKLQVKGPKGVMNPERAKLIGENKAELIGLLAAEKALDNKVPTRRANDADVPLSFQQQRLWFIDKFSGPSSAYNMPSHLLLEGAVDVDAVKQAFLTINSRHEALRSYIKERDDGTAVMCYHDPDDVDYIYEAHWNDSANSQQLIARFVDEGLARKFNLYKDKLIRVRLYQVGDQQYLLGVIAHHIIADGWSIGNLIFEFVECYKALVEKRQPRLPEVEIQYGDYAIWQAGQIAGGRWQRQLSFWRKQLEGSPTLVDLPTDYPRPSVQTFDGRALRFDLGEPLSTAVNRYVGDHKVSHFMFVSACFKIALSVLSGQEDVTLGTVIANRPMASVESTIGFFANTLPLRSVIDFQLSFEQFLDVVKNDALAAFEHQDIPFELLVDELDLARSTSVSPLFQSLFVWQNAHDEQFVFPGVEVSPVHRESGQAKFDLTLTMAEEDGIIGGGIQYRTELFKRASIDSIILLFKNVINTVVHNPKMALNRLSFNDEASRQAELDKGARKLEDFPFVSITDKFARSVGRWGNKIALTDTYKSLTYLELDAAGDKIAQTLVDNGVKRGDRVGLFLTRTVNAVIAILGVVKAGGCYVPVDPSSPASRADYILSNADVAIVLSENPYFDRFAPELTVLDVQALLDGPPVNYVTPEKNKVIAEDAAYIIYTSGSTGQPKGVHIPHRNVTRLLSSSNDFYGFDDTDVWSIFHSYAFDISVWEMWGALLYGGIAVMIPFEVSRSPQAFYQLVEEQGVTVLNKTPSAFYRFIAADLELQLGLDKLRYVICAGEALNIPALKPWFERHDDHKVKVINMYGITETTVHTTIRHILAHEANQPSSFIGTAIADLDLYLLDHNFEPVPHRVTGELFVGGPGLADYYHAKPGVTAERYVPNPFSNIPGDRLYRSGDLARYDADGELEYIGRSDFQVKVRGFRIELGEIEFALSQCPLVEKAYTRIVTSEGEEPAIVAWVIGKNGKAPAFNEIYDAISSSLPDYMLPAQIVNMESFPLTDNGKIDYRKLPLPERSEALSEALEHSYVAPRNELETALCEIWAETLKLDRVGVEDNYFALGGDSIKSIVLLSLAKKAGIALSLPLLFSNQTIDLLARAIVREGVEVVEQSRSKPFTGVADKDRALFPADIVDAYPLSALQAGMIYHTQVAPEKGHYHNVASMALGSFSVEYPLFKRALDMVMQKHPVMRTSFHFDQYSQPLQLVHQSIESPLRYFDWAGLSKDEQDQKIRELIDVQKRSFFNIEKAPLFRVFLCRLGDEDYQITWVDHHSVLDGWSVASLFTETLQFYFAMLKDQLPPDHMENVPPLKSLYRDYILAEQAALNDPETVAYWDKVVEDAPQFRFENPDNSTEEQSEFRYLVPFAEDFTPRLHEFAKARAVPLKTVLLAVHMKVMTCLTGQQDVISGIVLNGRLEEEDGQRVLGLFLNTLPVRLTLNDPQQSWAGLVDQVFKIEQELLNHRRYPLAEIQRRNNGHELFDIAFNFISFHVLREVAEDGDGITTEETEQFQKNNFALMAGFKDDPNNREISLDMQYDLEKISLDMVKVIGELFATAIGRMLDEPEAQHRRSGLLPDAIWQQQCAWLKGGEQRSDIPTIVERVTAQGENTPDAIALSCDDDQLTYAQMNSQSDNLARYLVKHGVEPGMRVAICMQRKIPMVLSMLAVMKAGAAYVPVDPNYPAQRIADILGDAGAVKILSDSVSLQTVTLESERVVNVNALDLDLAIDAQLPDPHYDGLAYLIYTSGSTGKPKGVQIAQPNVAAMLEWALSYFSQEQLRHTLASTSVCFDISVFELFAPLCCGATVHLVDSILDLSFKTIDDLTLINTVPSALNGLLEADALPKSVTTVNVAGEPLQRVLVDKAYATGNVEKVINLYGPSEDTTYSTYALIAKDRSDKPIIGHLLDGSWGYILDEDLSPVLTGTVGELYIAGNGLSRGYWQNPAQTGERYLPDPFSAVAGARMYRTGDTVRLLPDGALDYIGRVDHQVKVQGFRIELGEIEHVLSRDDAVEQCVAVVQQHKAHKRIVAFVVKSQEFGVANEDDSERLLQIAEQNLPRYMVPEHIEWLAELPLTANGKVDKKQLPIVDAVKVASVSEAVQGETESQLADIWREVIGIDELGRHDNFFAIGGDSILSIQVVAKARKQGLNLSPKILFDNPTIAELGVVVAGAERIEINAEQGPVSGEIILTPIQRWFFEQQLSEQHHWNQAIVLNVPEDVDIEVLSRSLQKLVAHHDMLRASYRQDEQGNWHQRIDEQISNIDLDVVKLEATDEQQLAQDWELSVNRIQGSLDLDTKVVNFTLLRSALGNRLVMVAHHLVVDAVSWRVIIEDLNTLYDAERKNIEPDLPGKSTSFKYWADKLSAYATDSELLASEDYWTRLQPLDPIPTDLSGENTVASSQNVALSLSQENTEKLLRQCSKAYNTEINDLLLTGFAQAMQNWTGSNVTGLMMEGHGREDLFADVDHTRTVGWFTTTYPLQLTLPESDSTADAIKSIKEQLRALPGKGLGYGVLRYLANHEAAPQLPELNHEVSFNYLGQFDQQLSQSDSSFSGGEGSVGHLHALSQQRSFVLDVTSFVIKGELNLSISYSGNLHHRASIEKLAKDYIAQLEILIEHCAQERLLGITPSDYPLTDISQADLDRLLQERIELDNLQDLYPATPLQEGLIYLSEVTPNSGAYVVQMVFEFEGAFNVEAYTAAWTQMMNDCDILRTEFARTADGTLMQIVHRQVAPQICVFDWRGDSVQDIAAKWDDQMTQDRHNGFDFSEKTLIRSFVAKTSDSQFKVCMTYHHALLDGWSIPLLMGQLFGNYWQAHQGLALQRFEVAPYRNYIQWLQSRSNGKAEHFWQQYLGDFETPSQINLLKTTTSRSAGNYVNLRRTVEGRDLAAINDYAKTRQLTLGVVVQGVWALTLGQYSGRNDVVFGVTNAGRPAELDDADNMIGLFINTVPVRVKLHGFLTLSELLGNILEKQVQLQEYSYLPLNDIQRLSGVTLEQNLFDSLFVFENYPVSDVGGEGETDDVAGGLLESKEQATYPVTLCVVPNDQGIIVNFNYDERLCSAEDAERLIDSYVKLLNGITQYGDTCIAELPTDGKLIPPVVKSYPDNMLKVFKANVEKYPDNLAIRGYDLDGRLMQYNYRELLSEATAWQEYFADLGPGRIVGVCLPRSAKMVPLMLGIMASNNIHLPIDPEYPTERMDFLMKNSRPVKVITTKADVGRFDHPDVVDIDSVTLNGEATDFNTDVLANGQAYVIYTSGSTGTPKGALMHHQGLANCIMAVSEAMDIDENERFMGFASFCFDASMIEIFGALGSGGSVHILSRAERGLTAEFDQMMKDYQATWTLLPPTVLRLMDTDRLKSLRILCSGGEATDSSVVEKWVNETKLYNVYGPTETTIYSNMYPVPVFEELPPIGSMVNNLTGYVLDENLQPAPVGVTGEYYISGIGLGYGYHNNPVMTAKAYVPCPFGKPGERMYRTGDLVRYNHDGDIEYVSRVDNQVKIRGFRVELGEIEIALMALDWVKDAAVLVKTAENGHKHLVAFIDLDESEGFNPANTKKALTDQLPQYMVPSFFVPVSPIPLNANGKVDRHLLATFEHTALNQAEYLPPQTTSEILLAEIWAEVLVLDEVSRDANFFELGGHSLMVMSVINTLNEKLNLGLTVDLIYKHSQLSALAQQIDIHQYLAAEQDQAQDEEQNQEEWEDEQEWEDADDDWEDADDFEGDA